MCKLVNEHDIFFYNMTSDYIINMTNIIISWYKKYKEKILKKFKTKI